MTQHQPDKQGSRVRELARVSAQASARAFGQLCAQQVRADEARVCSGSGAAVVGKLDTGIFFELEGDANGVVALLLTDAGRDGVIERLGAESQADSALREVGNIVASHAVSAVADRLGGCVSLSVPTLVRDEAGNVLDRLLARRNDSVVTTTLLRGAGDGPDALLVFALEAA
jgi:chemotaxis protein CheY-P-specific phosphatase CheC